MKPALIAFSILYPLFDIESHERGSTIVRIGPFGIQSAQQK